MLGAGNNQTLHVDFIPADTTTYASASMDIKINVVKAAPGRNTQTNQIIQSAPKPGNPAKSTVGEKAVGTSTTKLPETGGPARSSDVVVNKTPVAPGQRLPTGK